MVRYQVAVLWQAGELQTAHRSQPATTAQCKMQMCPPTEALAEEGLGVGLGLGAGLGEGEGLGDGEGLTDCGRRQGGGQDV